MLATHVQLPVVTSRLYLRISPRTIWPRPESHADIPLGRTTFFPVSPCSFTISLSKKTNFLHCKNAAIFLALAQALTRPDHVTEGHVIMPFLPSLVERLPVVKLVSTHENLVWFILNCVAETKITSVFDVRCNYTPNYAWKHIVIWEETYFESLAYHNCDLLEF